MSKEYTGKIKDVGQTVHVPTGIKYDQGKLRLAEMIVDFAPELEELCKVWEFGANKYEKSNWKLVENGFDRYSNALIRHLIAERECVWDDESKLLHAAHISFNALARMHFLIETMKYGTLTPVEHHEDTGKLSNFIDSIGKVLYYKGILLTKEQTDKLEEILDNIVFRGE